MPVFSAGNWLLENSSTTGTGTLTLTGAVGNNPTLLQVFGAGVTSKVPYSIMDNGVEVESGLGSYDGSTQQFSRSPDATWVAGVYDDTSPAPVDLQGPVVLRVTLNAEQYKSIAPEAPDDNYGYLREGGVSEQWSRGARVFEQPTDPGVAAAIGDFWIDTSP